MAYLQVSRCKPRAVSSSEFRLQGLGEWSGDEASHGPHGAPRMLCILQQDELILIASLNGWLSVPEGHLIPNCHSRVVQ